MRPFSFDARDVFRGPGHELGPRGNTEVCIKRKVRKDIYGRRITNFFLLWFLIGADMMMLLIAMFIAIVAYGYLAWATYRYIRRSFREWYERRLKP